MPRTSGLSKEQLKQMLDSVADPSNVVISKIDLFRLLQYNAEAEYGHKDLETAWFSGDEDWLTRVDESWDAAAELLDSDEYERLLKREGREATPNVTLP